MLWKISYHSLRKSSVSQYFRASVDFNTRILTKLLKSPSCLLEGNTYVSWKRGPPVCWRIPMSRMESSPSHTTTRFLPVAINARTESPPVTTLALYLRDEMFRFFLLLQRRQRPGIIWRKKEIRSENIFASSIKLYLCVVVIQVLLFTFDGE